MKPIPLNGDEGKRVRMPTFPVVPFLCVFALAMAESAPAVDRETVEGMSVRNIALANDPGDRPPAGSQLAFVRDDQIYLVNADGTGLVQLTNTGGGISNSEPAWSHDGQRLAFARSSYGGGVYQTWDIYVMDADGSNLVQITDGGYNVEPTWGPDDRTIAFSSQISLLVRTE